MSTFSEDNFSRNNEKDPVPAAAVADAIADGKNIAIESCTISGDLEVHGKLVRGAISILGTTFDNSVSFHKVAFSGPNVEFRNCEFIGGVAFNMSTFSELESPISFDESRFHSDVSFYDTKFNGPASFRKSDFRDNAIFVSVIFVRNADFTESIFRREADFSFASFSGSTDFRSATFIERAAFVQACSRLPANFEDVRFRENNVSRGLWNYIFRYPFYYSMLSISFPVSFIARVWQFAQSVSWVFNNVNTIWNVILSRIQSWEVVTDFYSLNTDTVMDGSSSPYLKRYIEEEQWLRSWRTSRSWRKPVFVVWELSSHCGRSFWLWAVWAVIIVFVFAGIYYYWVDIVYNVSDILTDKIDPDIRPPEPDFLTYMYYSIVTFTTLGFGDVIPLDNKARAAVWSEVVLGYIMLAVLLTIIGNRVARPS